MRKLKSSRRERPSFTIRRRHVIGGIAGWLMFVYLVGRTFLGGPWRESAVNGAFIEGLSAKRGSKLEVNGDLDDEINASTRDLSGRDGALPLLKNLARGKPAKRRGGLGQSWKDADLMDEIEEEENEDIDVGWADADKAEDDEDDDYYNGVKLQKGKKDDDLQREDTDTSKEIIVSGKQNPLSNLPSEAQGVSGKSGRLGTGEVGSRLKSTASHVEDEEEGDEKGNTEKKKDDVQLEPEDENAGEVIDLVSRNKDTAWKKWRSRLRRQNQGDKKKISQLFQKKKRARDQKLQARHSKAKGRLAKILEANQSWRQRFHKADSGEMPKEGSLQKIPDEKMYLQAWKSKHKWPPANKLSISMEQQNLFPVQNQWLFPEGGVHPDGIIIVLYIHNRPAYLKVTLDALSKVDGINETLLIVSHDGFYPEVNTIVKSISFCQVKQIYAPLSPHNFKDTFPGTSPDDCKEDDQRPPGSCEGHPDQFKHYRTVRTVSLKHHWWWMMNTVWDGLAETRDFNGHFLFMEEDHYLLPNAYRNAQRLVALKRDICPACMSVNLAPSRVESHGSGRTLVNERMGNIGYAFNRSVWERLHNLSEVFCNFDDYNWDMTLWSTIQDHVGQWHNLRGSRASAWHLGKNCGLHKGTAVGAQCKASDLTLPGITDEDKRPTDFITSNIKFLSTRTTLAEDFNGWGGWGDYRDRELCRHFSRMYDREPRQVTS